MIKKSILIICVLILHSCTNIKSAKSPKTEIKKPSTELYYKINEIDVIHIPDYTFKNPLLNRDLEFVQQDDLKNKYNGNVKRITEYYKLNNNRRKFYNSCLFNKEGYLIEKAYGQATYKYFYDANRNLIKEINLSETDTTYISNFSYNKKNQLIKINKTSPTNKSNRYDWFITIKYDDKNRPSLIENAHPIEKYSYQKELKYTGNIVTIYKIMNGKKKIVEEKIFSKNHELLKHHYNKTTLFDFYNSAGLSSKRIVFESNVYVRNITFEYNLKGDIIKDIVLNYQNPIEEIETVAYKYDNFGNSLYEKYSYNTKDDILEKYFEFEYFD